MEVSLTKALLLNQGQFDKTFAIKWILMDTELHRVAPSTTELLYFCFIYFLLVHRVPPSCTEFHRVPPSYFIFVLYTSYLHRVPPSCTELQRVPPSYFIFALYTSSLHRVPPSYSFLLNILMSCTEYHRY